MPTRQATAEWKGTLQQGSGSVSTASGALSSPYSFQARFGEGAGTNPEELIGAAHAGCLSMALSAILGEDGIQPQRIQTTARVNLTQHEGEFSISRIDLTVEGEVDGLDEKQFQEYAEMAKKNCPVSRALSSVPMQMTARLVKGEARGQRA